MSFNKDVFQSNPVRLDVSRSKFNLSHSWQGTGNVAKLIPFLAYSDILPGDTFKLGVSTVIRTTTPIAPVMGDLVCDEYFFFVPHTMTLSREMMSPSVDNANHSFAAFIGAQDSLLNMPLPDNDIELPWIGFGSYDKDPETRPTEVPFEKQSLADYLALPSVEASYRSKGYIDSSSDLNLRMVALEPLAYYCVWNHYFRDENLFNPVTYSIDSNNFVHLNCELFKPFNSSVGISVGESSSVLSACRFHGYFGSALPWPQRNSTTLSIPLGDSADLVFTDEITSQSGPAQLEFMLGDKVATIDNANIPGLKSGFRLAGLKTDLTTATSVSINSFRSIFQTQRWYEALARGGNRLGELTKSMFGVTPHDIGDDRPEYLGGRRFNLVQTQVANTAGTNISTDKQQAIGSTGAYSLTTDSASIFTKSFDSWGTIIGLIVIRCRDRFHQGLAKRHFRYKRFEYYWTQFANLGEQPIYSKEIYFSATDINNKVSGNDNVFGYQEAWADYRFFPDTTTGYMRPGNSQAYWNYCTNFGARPTLKSFILADDQQSLVDRTLQVPSDTAGFQFMIDAYFDITAVRPMPMHSIPGLIDHH